MPNNLFEKADKFTQETYKISLKLPQIYQFSIGDQIRRSSLSVVLNIVEGGARKSDKEKRQFLNISFGSLKETKYLIYMMYKLNLLNINTFTSLKEEANELARIMYSIIYRRS